MGAPFPDGPPPARLLDLTRLVSRVGRGPWTGIDRVEAAWLDRLLDEPEPLFALVRTSLGFILLDRDGTQAIKERLHDRVAWGPVGPLAWLSFKASQGRKRALSDLRRLALARSSRLGLGAMLRRHLPAGTAWINIGHTNLGASVFDAVKSIPGGRAHILLHDVIPLMFPDWQDPRVRARFVRAVQTISAGADLVLCNSMVTRADATEVFQRLGRVPPTIVSHLGIAPARPDPETVPPDLRLHRPYFVALGTLQPHKNIGFLLDIWDHFARTLPAAECPALLLLGARSPMNPELNARLEASPLAGQLVMERAGLDDAAVAALVAEARAVLMPSHYEGFGLPAGEALVLGTPALVNDLPVFHEVLGNNPVYLKVDDMYLWANQIINLARADKSAFRAADGRGRNLPTWQDHFNLVLKVT